MALTSFRELLLFRLRTFYREPDVVFWVFAFPIVATAAFGLAFRPGEPSSLAIAVLAVDPEVAARTRSALEASPDLAVRAMQDPVATDRALARGEVALVVVAARPPRYRLDPGRRESRAARLAVEALLAAPRDGRDGRATATVEHVVAPGRRYVDFLVPGLVSLLVMNTTLWGVGFSFVEMRTRRVLKRLSATPVSRAELLLAQVASRLIFTTIMAATTFAFGALSFGVTIQGSVAAVLFLVVLGTLAFSGMALAVGARVARTETAHGVLTAISLPMVLGSGVFFSPMGYPLASSGFPPWLRAAIAPLPLTLLADALREVVNEGTSLASLPGSITLLGAWGLVPALWAVRAFRWT